jgi:hypothetical protein
VPHLEGTTRLYFLAPEAAMSGLVHPGDHQCFSHGTRQRQPHVRFSMVHLYKNDTMNWGIYTLDLAAII